MLTNNNLIQGLTKWAKKSPGAQANSISQTKEQANLRNLLISPLALVQIIIWSNFVVLLKSDLDVTPT